MGEYMDLTRIDMATRTEITAIISLLGFGTKCLEASYPYCSLCTDLIVVRIDMTGPFPIL